jgi:hypothetical protein
MESKEYLIDKCSKFKSFIRDRQVLLSKDSRKKQDVLLSKAMDRIIKDNYRDNLAQSNLIGRDNLADSNLIWLNLADSNLIWLKGVANSNLIWRDMDNRI